MSNSVLSPDEWQALRYDNGTLSERLLPYITKPEAVIAIANDTLAETNPQKITPAGIRAMRSDADWLDLRNDPGCTAVAAKLRAVADGLERYLPQLI